MRGRYETLRLRSYLESCAWGCYRRLPAGFREWVLTRELGGAPPGHFYSPYASVESPELPTVSPNGQCVPGIDIREDDQLALVDVLRPLAEEFARAFASGNGTRRYDLRRANAFRGADAAVLYALLRHSTPQRVIELGAGWSSALILDAAARHLSTDIELLFVDPHPERLESLLLPEDVVNLKRSPAQAITPDDVSTLASGDILFVDTTHVVKHGSDVNHIVFTLLPALAPGVLVHFHDVFWPFDYPREWIEQRRAWAEAYLLRAFLQYNSRFEIVLFLDYLAMRHPEIARALNPTPEYHRPGSLWLRRTGG
jgi:predicted O-methyltransferase YrrM